MAIAPETVSAVSRRYDAIGDDCPGRSWTSDLQIKVPAVPIRALGMTAQRRPTRQKPSGEGGGGQGLGKRAVPGRRNVHECAIETAPPGSGIVHWIPQGQDLDLARLGFSAQGRTGVSLRWQDCTDSPSLDKYRSGASGEAIQYRVSIVEVEL